VKAAQERSSGCQKRVARERVPKFAFPPVRQGGKKIRILSQTREIATHDVPSPSQKERDLRGKSQGTPFELGAKRGGPYLKALAVGGKETDSQHQRKKKKIKKSRPQDIKGQDNRQAQGSQPNRRGDNAWKKSSGTIKGTSGQQTHFSGREENGISIREINIQCPLSSRKQPGVVRKGTQRNGPQESKEVALQAGGPLGGN